MPRATGLHCHRRGWLRKFCGLGCEPIVVECRRRRAERATVFGLGRDRGTVADVASEYRSEHERGHVSAD
jgi:hypothetical protein